MGRLRNDYFTSNTKTRLFTRQHHFVLHKRVRNNTEISTSELMMNKRILDHTILLGIKVNPQHNPPM